MKILLTGCAGFIGSNVAALLSEQDHEVVGIDNLNDAYDTRLKHWRLSQLDGLGGFSFTRLDLSDAGGLSGLFRDREFDAVINLAARAGVRQSIENPTVYYETNVLGTLNLLELCKDHGVSKFVLASTSSVYGDAERPYREDARTDRPLSPYAASKKAAEGLCYTYHHVYGIDSTVFRFFTVYGPSGRPDMSIFRFIRWIAEEEPITLFGDGSQERDFTYVEDVARGVAAGLKPVGYEIINIGSDRPVTISSVIASIEDRFDKNAVIDHQPFQSTDVRATWADISKADRILDWRPQVTLEQGLANAADWYIDNRDWASRLALE